MPSTNRPSTMLPPPYAHAPAVTLPKHRTASTAGFAVVLVDRHAMYGTRWTLATQTTNTIAPRRPGGGMIPAETAPGAGSGR